MHVSRNSSASMMFRASTNIPSHLLRASYSMCYKPPYFPNINGRNQAGASLRLDNRNSHPNASPKRMFRLSRLTVVSAHAATNPPRFVPLVIPHYLPIATTDRPERVKKKSQNMSSGCGHLESCLDSKFSGFLLAKMWGNLGGLVVTLWRTAARA